jgi:hypothetical protein
MFFHVAVVTLMILVFYIGNVQDDIFYKGHVHVDIFLHR